MVTIAGAYRAVRARVLDLADGMSEADAARPVPACPLWSVKDVYAHFAGVQADILDGRLDGVATDPWTARQVAERAGHSLEAIVAEWRSRMGALDAVLDAIGEAMDPRLAIDAWTHEQDLRHALDRPGGRDGPEVTTVAGSLLAFLGAQLGEAGLPGIRWADEHGAVHLAGSGEPGVTLRCSTFDFCRARLGRRSPAQLRALGWDSDPAPFLDVFVVFGPTTVDIDG